MFRPRQAYGRGLQSKAEVDQGGRVVRDEAGRRITQPRTDSREALTAQPSPPPVRDVLEPAAGGLPLALEWHRSTYGTGIGFTGLHAVDVDQDGEREIVAAASGVGFFGNSFWYVLEHRSGEYVHVWTSLPYPSGIQSLRVANVDSDTAPEVLVGTGNRILVYDGATRALEATLTTAATATVRSSSSSAMPTTSTPTMP